MIEREALKRPARPESGEDTWAERARATIKAVDQALHPGATLQERRASVDAAYSFLRHADDPYQAWCRVRRHCRSTFGYVPQTASKGSRIKIREGKS